MRTHIISRTSRVVKNKIAGFVQSILHDATDACTIDWLTVVVSNINHDASANIQLQYYNYTLPCKLISTTLFESPWFACNKEIQCGYQYDILMEFHSYSAHRILDIQERREKRHMIISEQLPSTISDIILDYLCYKTKTN